MRAACVPTDRRRYRRFSVFSNAIAILNRGSIHSGRITEISLNGLVFLYRCDGEPRLDASEIDILVPGFTEAIFLEKLPVKTVSDLDIEERDAMNQTRLRKHAIEIGPLTTKQKAKLEQFIRLYARSSKSGFNNFPAHSSR